MSTRPHPVMACAECGPVITAFTPFCPLVGPAVDGHEVYWVDLAAGLEHLSSVFMAAPNNRLLIDAANLIRAQQDTIESMQQAQGGAKRRRQEEKARRLAEVIREHYEAQREVRSTNGWQQMLVEAMPRWSYEGWAMFVSRVNARYPNDPINPPSDETKALVAAKFAEPQEARR